MFIFLLNSVTRILYIRVRCVRTDVLDERKPVGVFIFVRMRARVNKFKVKPVTESERKNILNVKILYYYSLPTGMIPHLTPIFHSMNTLNFRDSNSM